MAVQPMTGGIAPGIAPTTVFRAGAAFQRGVKQNVAGERERAEEGGQCVDEEVEDRSAEESGRSGPATARVFVPIRPSRGGVDWRFEP